MSVHAHVCVCLSCLLVACQSNLSGLPNDSGAVATSKDSGVATTSDASVPSSTPEAAAPEPGDAAADAARPPSSAPEAGHLDASDGSIGSSRDAGAEPLRFDFAATSVLASEVVPEGSAMVGIVTCGTLPKGVREAFIEFGLDASYGMRAPLEITGTSARAVLLGLKPERIYHYRVVASDGTHTFASADLTLTTGAPPAALDTGEFQILDEASHASGFILASYWAGKGSSFAFIVDTDGEVVWAYDTGMFGGVARATISADGKSVWAVTAANGGASLVRVSIDTLEREVYADTVGSHDITPVEGDLMAYLDYSEDDCDSIFEIDSAGNRSEVWDSGDLLDGLTPGCHGNALHFWPSEELYTFSDLNHDIYAVDRSGTLLWRLSDRVAGAPTTWGGRTHGHDLLPDSLLIFANLGGPDNTSAAIEYATNGAELWRYQTEYYTGNLGDVQRLPGGNTLITFSNAKALQEVTRDKQVVMEWLAPASFGYPTFLTSLYRTTSF